MKLTPNLTMTNLAVIALAALAFAACAPRAGPADAAEASASLFAEAPDTRWNLPNKLREISGLVVLADGRVLGHADERATVSEIDANGGIVKSFMLGDPAEEGDFEDIAVTPAGDLYLVTSRGDLHRFREGADGAHVDFEALDTGLRDVCEVEGVAYFAAERSLVLACKANLDASAANTVSLYIWPVSGAAPARVWRQFEMSDLAAAAGARAFHPSAITFDTRSGRVLLLAGRERALVELSADGTIAAARRLDRSHRQPEGLAISADGALLIADEGSDARGTLTRYARAP